MNNKNPRPIDSIALLKKARPSSTSESRIDQLIKDSESKSSINYRSPLSPRLKLGLTLTPALFVLLAVSAFNPLTSTPKLNLDLGIGKSDSFSLGLGTGAIADCATVNRQCNDVGITAGVPIDWNYTVLPSVTTDAPEGHVYKLTSLGREKEIARLLTQEFGIDEPIQTDVEVVKNIVTGDVDYSQTQYTAGSRENRNVFVGFSKTDSYISYSDDTNKDWIRCHEGAKYSTRDCSSVVYEDMPSDYEASLYAQKLLKKMGLDSGFNLSNLKDNEFLIQVNKSDDTLIASARMVLNGQPTSTSLQFFWHTGSKNLSMINGTLYKAEDLGLFKTLTAEQSLERLNKYVTIPSVVKPFTNSLKSLAGMPWEEQKRLFQGLTGKANTKPVKIDVTISKAEIGLVTTYDVNRHAWVVPGINYFDESGYLGSATSLDGDYIQMDAKEE